MTIQLRLISTAALLTVICSHVHAVAHTGAVVVPIHALFAHPQKWDGKRVVVTGYYSADSAGHASYLSENVKRDADGQSAIFIDLSSGPPAARAHLSLNHWVRVTGKFRFVDTSKRQIIRKGVNGERDLVRTTSGFGWMGIYDRAMTNIENIEMVW